MDDHLLPLIPAVEEWLATPQHRLGILFFIQLVERLVRDASMNEEVMLGFVGQTQIVVEIQVVLRNEPVGAALLGVGLQGRAAPVVDEHAGSPRLGIFEEIEEHVLVIAPERDDVVALRQLEHGVDHAFGVGAAIDVVTAKYDGRLLSQRKLIEEHPQLNHAAVDIAHCKDHEFPYVTQGYHPLGRVKRGLVVRIEKSLTHRAQEFGFRPRLDQQELSQIGI